MKYHPDFHPNYGKPYTNSDYEYMCKFFVVDGANLLGMALGRPPKSISTTVGLLKRTGLFDYYKKVNHYW
ncbi:DNA-entry nuclease [Pontibacillus halophilus]|uniref:DNA-entry nuclease n=1 Tax=Pontibacillus halophilus TaxID=516704 RepID=UPI0004048969|nr:DNA-entry nuclease [Pontibacillus halophilus]